MGAQPTAALVQPEPSDPVPDVIEIGLGFNLISPTWYVQQFIISVSGFDPWDWAAQQFTGDWEAVQQAGAAIQNLGKYNGALAEAIHSGVGEVEQSWRGNASDSAQSYFDQLAKAIDAQSSPLHEMGDQLNTLAFAVYEGAKAIGDAIQSITDVAIIAVTEWAAGNALAASGVGAAGAAACWAASALQVTYMLAKIGKMIELWNFKVIGIEALLSAVLGTVGGAEFIDLPALPTAAYDNPGA